MDSRSVAAIILAGGQSSRFGTDKALFDFRGRPLVSYVVDAFSGIASRVVISISPGNSAIFKDLLGDSVEIVEDDSPFKGPLYGLKKTVENISEEFVLLAPCDMPFLNLALYKLLLARIDDNDAAIPVINDYFEPIIGAYRSISLRRSVELAISKGERKLSSILADLSVTDINERELKVAGIDKMTFLNINSQP